LKMKNLLSFTTKNASIALCVVSSALLKTAYCSSDEIEVTEFDNSAIFQCRNIFGREVVVIGSNCSEQQARKAIRNFHPKFVFFGMDNKFMTNVNQLRFERDVSLWEMKFHKGIGAGETDMIKNCRESGLVYRPKYGVSGAFRALFDTFTVGRNFGVYHMPDWMDVKPTYNMALFEAVRDETIHGNILSITCGPSVRILNASLLDLLGKTDEATRRANREWVSQTMRSDSLRQIEDNDLRVHRLEKLAIQRFPDVRSVLIDKVAIFIACTVHSISGQEQHAVAVKQEHFEAVKKHFQTLGYAETDNLLPSSFVPPKKHYTRNVAYLTQDSRF